MLWPPVSKPSEFWRSADRAASRPSLWRQRPARLAVALSPSSRSPCVKPTQKKRYLGWASPRHVDFILTDSATVLPRQADLDFAFIDCEKEDYIRFFDALRMRPGGIIVADNIISHSLSDYVAHVRRRPSAESITLEIGKGLEVTRVR